MKVRILEGETRLINLRTRMPFKYGIATMTDVPYAFLKLSVEIDGQAHTGYAADNLPPKWFTKKPEASIEAEIEEMLMPLIKAVEPIQMAAQRGALDVVDVLLEFGADLEQRNWRGEHLVHIAVNTRNMELLAYLVEQGMVWFEEVELELTFNSWLRRLRELFADFYVGVIRFQTLEHLFGPFKSMAFPNDGVFTHTISVKISHQKRCLALVQNEFCHYRSLLFWPVIPLILNGYPSQQRLPWDEKQLACDVHSLLEDLVRFRCRSPLF